MRFDSVASHKFSCTHGTLSDAGVVRRGAVDRALDVHPPVTDGQFTTDPPDVPAAMLQHVMDPGNKHD